MMCPILQAAQDQHVLMTQMLQSLTEQGAEGEGRGLAKGHEGVAKPITFPRLWRGRSRARLCRRAGHGRENLTHGNGRALDTGRMGASRARARSDRWRAKARRCANMQPVTQETHGKRTWRLQRLSRCCGGRPPPRCGAPECVCACVRAHPHTRAPRICCISRCQRRIVRCAQQREAGYLRPWLKCSLAGHIACIVCVCRQVDTSRCT